MLECSVLSLPDVMVSEMPDPDPRRDLRPLHSVDLGLSYRLLVEKGLSDAAAQSRRPQTEAGTP